MRADYFAIAADLARRQFQPAVDLLGPETDDERREREQREQNDARYLQAVRRWFDQTEPRP